MKGFLKYQLNDGPVPEKQTLKMNRSAENIVAEVSCFGFTDAQTGEYGLYIPSFELSATGADQAQAAEEMRANLQHLFVKFLYSYQEAVLDELFALGWTQHFFFKKDFSAPQPEAALVTRGRQVQDGKIDRLGISVAFDGERVVLDGMEMPGR